MEAKMKMKTMAEFCKLYGISIRAEWADSNPNMTDFEGTHYKVKLTRNDPHNHVRRSLTTYFSMGYAHTREPEVEAVLSCLADDAASVENAGRDFESWAREFGMDADSRKAERTFRACEKQSEKLMAFLGEGRFEELLYNTERG